VLVDGGGDLSTCFEFGVFGPWVHSFEIFFFSFFWGEYNQSFGPFSMFNISRVCARCEDPWRTLPYASLGLGYGGYGWTWKDVDLAGYLLVN